VADAHKSNLVERQYFGHNLYLLAFFDCACAKPPYFYFWTKILCH